MGDYILSIDQGTTSSRAILFDKKAQVVDICQQEFTQILPQSGWVEHDAEEIWQSTLQVCKELLKQAKISSTDIDSIGITNQRETIVVWDKDSGKPIYNAIVWQDKRTTDICNAIKAAGHEPTITSMTGLLCNPYFSASKIAWILDNVEGARQKSENGQLRMGTIDTYLIDRLSRGQAYVTDVTNASRTMLYDIHEHRWRNRLGDIFRVPVQYMAKVLDCSAEFAETAADIFGTPIKITGVAGDQQSALIGQACFDIGMMKSTYGTGCFALLNTGNKPYLSDNNLLTTIAYRLDGKTSYALEGSIFVAGAVVQWLRDGLQIIDEAAQSNDYATACKNDDIIFVPAFVGLGAPYWDSECRGAIFGLSRNTGREDICKAALQSVAFQTLDLLKAMQADWGSSRTTELRVDGGMVASDVTMQMIADILQVAVVRPESYETTALGAAYLAGRYSGFYPKEAEFQKNWKMQKRFSPNMNPDEAAEKYVRWQEAVQRVLS